MQFGTLLPSYGRQLSPGSTDGGHVLSGCVELLDVVDGEGFEDCGKTEKWS